MYYTYNLNPTILHLGPFEVRWYGLMYVTGMLLTYYFLKHYFIKKGSLKFPQLQVDNLIFWMFIGLLIGARSFYILFYNLDHYANNPLEVLAFWRGGLSFHGGLLGVIIATILFSKKLKTSILNIGDHLVFCGALGIGFGRIGNFINGELWGRVTTVPWAIIFPEAGVEPRHPSQIYECLLEGFIMSIIIYLIIRFQKKSGTAMFSFFVLYPIFRFFIEFFREPDSQLGLVGFGILSMGQLLCIAMLLAALIVWYIVVKNNESFPQIKKKLK